ncbi:P-loop NTPase [Candidatus Bathyarchaeota archaeon]|nr:P-loop NTPase [Candidatus Bathyarchaeota archaeon]
MVDPRRAIIGERLRGVENIIAVSSGKGGVGKSMIASTLALILARKGLRVGLFDLDFTSPATHLILGVGDLYPEEEYGIIPPRVHGLRYMSIVYYSKGETLPLRGADISNALIELLSVTRWGVLDFLIVDMPPGISDAALDVIRLIEGLKFLIVTTPSRLAFETVGKFMRLLSELDIRILGVIENMKISDSTFIQEQVEGRGVRFWGDIPFDRRLEETIGDVDRLLETEFAKKLKELVDKNLGI